MDLEVFELVLLSRSVTAPDLPETQLERLQEAHLAHLSRLHREGDMRRHDRSAISPMTDCGDSACTRSGIWRGSGLVQSDPSVRAGRLAVEVMVVLLSPR
jgi:hypothetical protein